MVPVRSAQLLVDGKTISVKVPLEASKVYEFDVAGARSLTGRTVTANTAYYRVNQ